MPAVIRTILTHLLHPSGFLVREILWAEAPGEVSDEVLPRNQFGDTVPFVHHDEVAVQP